MKAIMKTKSAKGVELRDIAVPVVAAHEVKIKVIKTAICGTDNHINQWDLWSSKTIKPPLVIGHEFVGEIIETGSKVTRVTVGDIVSAEGHIVGTESRSFREGQFHLSPDTLGVGVNRDGAFAEYVCVPAFNCVKIPKWLDMNVAAMLDPFGNAVHTALTYDLTAEDVLVVGGGPIGIMAALVAQKSGANSVYLSEPLEYRRNLALKAGVKCVINPFDEPDGDISKQCAKEDGFSIGLEMSGNPACHEFNDQRTHDRRESCCAWSAFKRTRIRLVPSCDERAKHSRNIRP